ncbi:MAG: hypothetical protein WEE89_06005 [Gemmatimonadota bacterium]
MRYLALTLFFVAGLADSAAAQKFEPVLERFVSYWARGDEDGIAALATRQGIQLDFNRKEMGPLAGRQAAALLRRLFEDHETINVRLMTSRSLDSQPKRAFGEISWMMTPRGTTIPEKTSVFVGLILEGENWRITEIRFVRP